MDTPVSSVWVQLFYEKNKEPDGRTIEITPAPEDVADLAEVVKAKLKLNAPLDQIYTYPPGTKPPFAKENSIEPDMKLEDLITEYNREKTLPTSYDHPLIVVAPPNKKTDFKTRLDEVHEYVMQLKQESAPLVVKLSNPSWDKYDRAMALFKITVDTPRWNSPPPQISNSTPLLPPPGGGYNWLPSDENSPENRKGYMAYLKEHVVLPTNTMFFDGNDDANLLSVRFRETNFDLKVSGTIDVAIARSHQQSMMTVRQNMLGAFELKKDSYTTDQEAEIDRQLILQHMTVSYLNPTTEVLTVMTDLNDRWIFYWFAKEGKKRLMRYQVDRRQALYLIEHMLDREETTCGAAAVSAPDGFLSRASWDELFSVTRAKFGSVPPGHGDEYLDYMDTEEELQAVLKYAVETSFHRIFSRYEDEDEQDDKDGSEPPSHISF